MTLRSDVARGRDLLACWRELAEQRLAYLTDMFESGRWRRYYSERAFLENVREAKIAVDTWRGLSTPSPTCNYIWLAPERAAQLRVMPPPAEPSAAEPSAAVRPSDEASAPEPPIEILVPEPPVVAKVETVPMGDAAAAALGDLLALQQVPDDAPKAAPSSDVAVIAVRYPLLRNSL
jgi:uncharacterized repeat protein (TIGR03809 family)